MFSSSGGGWGGGKVLVQGNNCLTAELGFKLLFEISTWLPSLNVNVTSGVSGELTPLYLWLANWDSAILSLSKLLRLIASSSGELSGAPSQLSRFPLSSDSMNRTDLLLFDSSSEVTESDDWKSWQPCTTTCQIVQLTLTTTLLSPILVKLASVLGWLCCFHSLPPFRIPLIGEFWLVGWFLSGSSSSLVCCLRFALLAVRGSKTNIWLLEFSENYNLLMSIYSTKDVLFLTWHPVFGNKHQNNLNIERLERSPKSHSRRKII